MIDACVIRGGIVFGLTFCLVFFSVCFLSFLLFFKGRFFVG